MSVFLCNTCNKNYDDLIRKPLSLPCGHVYCEECIITFKVYDESEKNNETSNLNSLKCPYDFQIHNIDLKKIPICYQILTNLPKNKNIINKKNVVNCIRHPNKKIKYYCKTDQIFPCSNCVVDHMTNAHNLESFEVSADTFVSEIKVISKSIESELMKYLEIKNHSEKIEKMVSDYFISQLSKIDLTYEKIKQIIADKKKIVKDQLKMSYEEHMKKTDREKSKLQKIMERINFIKSNLKHFEDNYENKKYEDFYKLKVSVLSELESLNSDNRITPELPFAYFSNHFKIDEISLGVVKYFKNLNEIENRHNDNKNEKTNKLNNDTNEINKNTENYSNITNSNSDKLENIFQDNLLNNNDKEKKSPKNSVRTKNSLSQKKVITNKRGINFKFYENNLENFSIRTNSNITSPKETIKDTIRDTIRDTMNETIKENIKESKDNTKENFKDNSNSNFKSPKNTIDSKLYVANNTNDIYIEENNNLNSNNDDAHLRNKKPSSSNPTNQVLPCSQRGTDINGIVNTNEINASKIMNTEHVSVNSSNYASNSGTNKNFNLIHQHMIHNLKNRNEKIAICQSDNKTFKTSSKDKSPSIKSAQNLMNKNITLYNNNITRNDNSLGNKNVNFNLNLNLNLGENLPDNNMIISSSNGNFISKQTIDKSEKRSSSNINEIKYNQNSISIPEGLFNNKLNSNIIQNNLNVKKIKKNENDSNQLRSNSNHNKVLKERKKETSKSKDKIHNKKNSDPKNSNKDPNLSF